MTGSLMSLLISLSCAKGVLATHAIDRAENFFSSSKNTVVWISKTLASSLKANSINL